MKYRGHETIGPFRPKRARPPSNHTDYGNLILDFDGYRFAGNAE
jgi:hypothetical protein